MDAIQRVFQEGYDECCAEGGFGLHQIKAARNIQRCRTGFFGVRLEQCPQGHEQIFRFNACHHRSCPQCNALPRQRWLDQVLPRLLPVSHRQIVFTISHDLLPLYRWNEKILINLLFECVAWTLKRYLFQPNRLGAEAGFVLAYHSWGRSLSLHPHIHALVTEGGMDTEGRWVAAKTASFLPAVAMMHSFRGRLLGKLGRLLKNEEIQLPPGMEKAEAYQLLRESGRKKWQVKVEKGYRHGEGLIKYLGRYLRGGPIKSHQIRQDGKGIALSYKDHRTKRRGYLRLSRSGLIRRLLTHVPPSHQPMVRHYGLYGNRRRAALEKVRRTLRIDQPQ